VATIIDHLIHSSIHFLVKKHMLNKLRWKFSGQMICNVYFVNELLKRQHQCK
jgi:hypothetical protein